MVWYKPWTWYEDKGIKAIKSEEIKSSRSENLRNDNQQSILGCSEGGGDCLFERRCQEIAGQRYSASEICGGPDPAYEQALREDESRWENNPLNWGR